MTRSRRLFALVLCALASGCANRVVPIQFHVLTKKCGSVPGPAPTDGVDHYKATLRAPDLQPVVQIFSAGAPARFEKVPPGSARQLTLVGYHGDPTNNAGSVKAVGQSAPFDVPDNVGDGRVVDVNVVLHPAGVFSGVQTVADPGTCAELAVPRAGHTATLLKDGRVLIAGGYALGDGGAGVTLPLDAGLDENGWSFTSSAEIFDPATGTSKLVAPIYDPAYVETPVAFHTASLLPSGKVLLAGGEVARGGRIDARPTTMTYDPAADGWSLSFMHAAELDDGGRNDLPRSRHQAATDSAGRVVLLGGVRYDARGSAVAAPEVIWLNPADAGYRAVADSSGAPLALPRPGVAATAAAGGGYVFALGGANPDDGGLASPPLVFFTYDAGYYLAGTEDESLLSPVTHAALAPLGTDTGHLLVAGGLGADGRPVALAQEIGLYPPPANGTTPLQPAQQRQDPCAAVLHDGRVLVLGGQGAGPTSSAQADLYVINGGRTTLVTTGSLVQGRTQHTCTVLGDGSVLVTGGVSFANGQTTVLKSMELYVPVPLE